MNTVATTNETVFTGRNKIHPHKFALYVACASIVMLFTAFTSAYIVRQASGNWLEFRLPDLFFVNTGVILLSSLTLQTSYWSFKRDKKEAYRGLLTLSFLLGLTFLVLQYKAWQSMAEIGVMLDGNPSGSFIYLISGVHAAHVLGGIAALFVALTHAFILPVKATPRRTLRFELVLIYWHFVGFLWLYLLGFFVVSAG
ncbi:MAG: cytochrome c oxidase subunit 3 [Saprospirales bacterium]|nr:cytochrome c oxidase subunit 3 [Saprospirales bacterium]